MRDKTIYRLTTVPVKTNILLFGGMGRMEKI